ncbi:hypothetical protein [Actinoplanes sp. NPDC048796]|uniref:hypothetical protein n=1 Tax=Actinoplanes sp. NPDC048796 TaxID=3155640 RepID=UPI00340778F3
MKYVGFFLAFVVGVAAFVYGGADDSPGLQLLAAVLVLAVIALVVRNLRQRN